jgi:hypothetical protein
MLLVAAWSYTSLQDIQGTRAPFASSQLFEPAAAGTLSVLAGLLTEAALRRWTLWTLPLALLPPVAAALLLADSGAGWQLAVSLVVLIALTARSAMHEAWQLSAGVPTVEEFEREYPEQQSPSESTEGDDDPNEAKQGAELKSCCSSRVVLGQEFEALLAPESDTGNEQDPATGPQEHTALLAQTTEAASEQTEQQASEEPSQQTAAQEQELPEVPELPKLPPGWTGPHPVERGEPGFDLDLFMLDKPQTKMKWFHYLKNKTVYERPTPAETGLHQNPEEDLQEESKVQESTKDRSLHRQLQVTQCAATHRCIFARVFSSN